MLAAEHLCSAGVSQPRSRRQQASQPRHVAVARLWHRIEGAVFVVEHAWKRGHFCRQKCAWKLDNCRCSNKSRSSMGESEPLPVSMWEETGPGGKPAAAGERSVAFARQLGSGEGWDARQIFPSIQALPDYGFVAGGRSCGCPEQTCQE